MKSTFLWSFLAAAIPLAGAQESRPTLAATAGDRAEILKMYDKPGQLGVIQVAAAPSAAAVAAPLFPRYAGFDAELAFSAPAAFARIEKVRPAAEAPDIEAPTDLRDALAAIPPMAPGMSQLPPSAVLKTGVPAALTAPERKAPAIGPAGWLVVTRKNGREVRPLNTEEDVARWTAAAELQRRAYEASILERFSNNLGQLGKPAK
ncbi:MAG: hypothetical protein FD126_163 [Elusimicrobia bacterium]|nr:MAG: hypothetical protein FD126_163 [Elusimicrobiota bacterium]